MDGDRVTSKQLGWERPHILGLVALLLLRGMQVCSPMSVGQLHAKLATAILSPMKYVSTHMGQVHAAIFMQNASQVALAHERVSIAWTAFPRRPRL